MSIVRGLVKSAVAVKIAQVAQRELSKPENQRKIREGLRKGQEKTRRRESSYAGGADKPQRRMVILSPGRR